MVNYQEDALFLQLIEKTESKHIRWFRFAPSDHPIYLRTRVRCGDEEWQVHLSRSGHKAQVNGGHVSGIEGSGSCREFDWGILIKDLWQSALPRAEVHEMGPGDGLRLFPPRDDPDGSPEGLTEVLRRIVVPVLDGWEPPMIEQRWEW